MKYLLTLLFSIGLAQAAPKFVYKDKVMIKPRCKLTTDMEFHQCIRLGVVNSVTKTTLGYMYNLYVHCAKGVKLDVLYKQTCLQLRGKRR